jgi:hypothetical protein
MTDKEFQLKAIDNSLSTFPITRDSLIVPLKMGQTNPEKKARRYD